MAQSKCFTCAEGRATVETDLSAVRRPVNRGRLKEFRENIISRSLRFSSLGAWRDNGYSDPEWATEHLANPQEVNGGERGRF